MRTVEIGSQRFTKAVAVDEPTHGNACHQYQVWTINPLSKTSSASSELSERVATVNFQSGPILENGINGCHHEDLLVIVLDRLQSFQKGNYSCRENALAITKIEEALHWLNHRTSNRQSRGVEGKSEA